MSLSRKTSRTLCISQRYKKSTAGATASMQPRRRYMQILAPGAERLLLDGRSHRSAYRRRTCVVADCDAQRAAVGPLCRAGIVSVRGPIPAALHTRRLRRRKWTLDMPQRTDWMRPLRYDVNHSNTLPPISYDIT